MQEIIIKTKKKLTITNKDVLGTLLRIMLREGYSFNSSEEIQTTVKKKFKADVSIDLIEELWVEGRMIDDVNYLYKHLY